MFFAGIMCLLVAFVGAQAEADGAQTGGEPAAVAPVDETSILIDAGTEVQPGQNAGAAASVGFWDFFRMILVLALVVAAIYGIYYLVRRGRTQAPLESGLIKVLATRSIGPNRNLHLVDAGGKILLLGASEGSISLLAEVLDPLQVDEIRLQASTEHTRPPANFAELLGGLFPRNAGSGTTGSGAGKGQL